MRLELVRVAVVWYDARGAHHREMGLDVSSLPHGALPKYLRTMLDSAQYGMRLQPFVDLNALPEWPKPDSATRRTRFIQHYMPKTEASPPVAQDPTSLAQVIERGDCDEAKGLYERAHKYSGAAFQIPDPFAGLRIAVLELAKLCDCGSLWMMVGCTEKRHIINIRVVSIRKLHDRTPVFVVLYGAACPDEDVQFVAWALARNAATPLNPGVAYLNSNQFMVHRLTVKLLLQMLQMNRSLVPPDLPIERKRLKENFAASVLGPVGPLYEIFFAGIQNRLLCATCRARSRKECSQCFAVVYCNEECQRKHWAVHRDDCIPRAAPGRWITVQASDLHSDPSRSGHLTNTVDLVQHPAADARRRAKPFVVKLWHPSCLVPYTPGCIRGYYRTMEMIDSRRSLVLSISDPRELLDILEQELIGPRIEYGGMRMYRWAKRTGTWTYDICVDRVPPAALSGW
ncbi:uncharacterized protein BXZ73DRAFT_60081 [Epithele typhae]|uniref:uncharacterized protein n=1 Tax=Epithele typhae TaxID=378194 RepID=UPI002008260C|nr:uncharacterized protein BXZ73DRAFT_60081 [Epithele typhae]KAH9908229.1 hypothetical protein BXZ73DRAFT_60081 [Epithele typhae]